VLHSLPFVTFRCSVYVCCCVHVTTFDFVRYVTLFTFWFCTVRCCVVVFRCIVVVCFLLPRLSFLLLLNVDFRHWFVVVLPLPLIGYHVLPRSWFYACVRVVYYCHTTTTCCSCCVRLPFGCVYICSTAFVDAVRCCRFTFCLYVGFGLRCSELLMPVFAFGLLLRCTTPLRYVVRFLVDYVLRCSGYSFVGLVAAASAVGLVGSFCTVVPVWLRVVYAPFVYGSFVCWFPVTVGYHWLVVVVVRFVAIRYHLIAVLRSLRFVTFLRGLQFDCCLVCYVYYHVLRCTICCVYVLVWVTVLRSLLFVCSVTFVFVTFWCCYTTFRLRSRCCCYVYVYDLIALFPVCLFVVLLLFAFVRCYVVV
jgi:hypothetical protein